MRAHRAPIAATRYTRVADRSTSVARPRVLVATEPRALRHERLLGDSVAAEAFVHAVDDDRLALLHAVERVDVVGVGRTLAPAELVDVPVEEPARVRMVLDPRL